ncbi:hypothetical protein IA539_11625 [Gordonia sp. zg691]|uniref:hypothetical protein n=1 Tax=Gordonia jinghuaiqii TaxID=2758710 RepID=UPI001662349F|nr:hypothetical protein [Gordonia jinghuaiqii]MBD0861858.1 hypothetical protein [Gordonia jinghuaiqii]
MSKDSEPESRPISVSELLARSQGAGGGNTPTRARDGRGRRRAGRDGSVSVSELTGEIPKITDATTASGTDTPGPETASRKAAPAEAAAPTRKPTSRRAAEPAVEPEATVEPEPESSVEPESTAEPEQVESRAAEKAAPSRPAPDSWTQTRSGAPSGPFPRSTNPIPRRPADDRPIVERPRPGRAQAHPGGWTASGMPAFGEAPPMSTRDFSSDAVARRLGKNPPRDTAPVDEESANAVTGIIPLVDGPDHGGHTEGLAVVDSEDVVTHDLAEVDPGTRGPRERGDRGFSEVMDFDAYRNFADVESDTDKPATKGWAAATAKAAGKGKGGLIQRLFGRKNKAAPTHDDPTHDDPTHGDDRAHGAAARDPHDPASDARGDGDSDWADSDWMATAAAAATAGGTTAALAASRTDDHPTEAIQPIDDAPRDESSAEESHAEDSNAHEANADESSPREANADGSSADEPNTGDSSAGDSSAGDSSAADSSTDESSADASDADESDADESDRTHAWAAPRAWSDPGRSDATDRVDLVKDVESDDAAGRPPGPPTLQDTADIDETPGPGSGGDVAREDSASTADAGRTASGQVVTEPEGSGPDGSAQDTDREDDGSPVTAWLLLFGQAIAGLAIGVGLFWGFTELWRWNPYFALVLAVLVIFGIVTLSHVVRRTKDLPTTLLALGVGLLVTIGPLVLLAA